MTEALIGDSLKLSSCAWAKGEDYLHYHDNEWGKPCYDSLALFEKLCLEGQQAGLSWITVLRKRPCYRQRFFDFVPEKVAQMTDAMLEDCLSDSGLIRHRLKIYAIRNNARAYIKMVTSGIDFSDFIWAFVDHQPQIHRFLTAAEVPSQSLGSKAMSRALKSHGFSFVGPTICYAFMQSMGLVNDHLRNCPQHPDHQTPSLTSSSASSLASSINSQ